MRRIPGGQIRSTGRRSCSSATRRTVGWEAGGSSRGMGLCELSHTGGCGNTGDAPASDTPGALNTECPVENRSPTVKKILALGAVAASALTFGIMPLQPASAGSVGGAECRGDVTMARSADTYHVTFRAHQRA